MKRVGLGVITLMMLFPALASADEHLKLSVNKKRVVVAERECLKVVATNHKGVRVKGAVVSLDDKVGKTDKLGRAKVCNKFLYGGTHAIHAQKGSSTAYKIVEARRVGPGGSGGSWEKLEIQLPAYNKPCQGFAFGEQWGYCKGDPNPGVNSVAFTSGEIEIGWGPPTPSFWLSFANPYSGDRAKMEGRLSSAGSGDYYITSLEKVYDKSVRFQGGSDPSKRGDPGGPIMIRVTSHENVFGARDGYTFHLKGWVWQERKN